MKLKDCTRNITAVCNLRQIQSKTKFGPRQIQSETKFSLRQIQSETKFSPRQNSVQKKIFSDHQKKILELNFVSDCILSPTEFVSDFQYTFLSCLGPFEAYHH